MLVINKACIILHFNMWKYSYNRSSVEVFNFLFYYYLPQNNCLQKCLLYENYTFPINEILSFLAESQMCL